MSQSDWGIIGLVIVGLLLVLYAGWRIVQAGDDDQ